MRSLVLIVVLAWLAGPSLAAQATPDGAAVARECGALFLAGDRAGLESRLAKWLADDAQDELGTPLATYCVGAFGAVLTDDQLAAVDRWAREAPKSHAAHVIAGFAWLARGRKARGTGRASTVSAEQLEELRRCAGRARVLLKQAEELKPGDPLAPLVLIWTLVYLGAPERDVVDAFERAVSAHPEWWPPYEAMTSYLLPQWHGSAERLLRFVRAIRDAHPSNPRLIVAVGNAHYDLRVHSGSHAYFRDPAKWRETRDSYLSYVAIRPARAGTWGRLARLAIEAGDDDTVLHAYERYAQLEPNPKVTVDEIDMTPMRLRAEQVARMRLASGAGRKLEWNAIPLGPGGRPVAEAALRVLRTPAATPPPAGAVHGRPDGAKDTPHARP